MFQYRREDSADNGNLLKHIAIDQLSASKYSTQCVHSANSEPKRRADIIIDIGSYQGLRTQLNASCELISRPPGIGDNYVVELRTIDNECNVFNIKI